MTSPLWPVINYALLGILLFVGWVGVMLALVPEHTKVHTWVERKLMPTALSAVALIGASVFFVGIVEAFLILRSVQ